MFPFAVTLAVVFSASPPAARWTVTGTDVQFEASPDQLRAMRQGKELGNLKAACAYQVVQPEPQVGEDRSGWELHASSQVLSIVGTWVSTRDTFSAYTGGAHGSVTTSTSLVDWADHAPFALLTVFGEPAVLAALKADPFLRAHVARGQRARFQ